MTDNPIQLRISAKNVYANLFRHVKLENFFNYAGYRLSNHAPSVEGRAVALAKYCGSPQSTTRRWITGESQPNATNTLLIYGALLAHIFDGDQIHMLHDFLEWHDRRLLKVYFFDR